MPFPFSLRYRSKELAIKAALEFGQRYIQMLGDDAWRVLPGFPGHFNYVWVVSPDGSSIRCL